MLIAGTLVAVLLYVIWATNKAETAAEDSLLVKQMSSTNDKANQVDKDDKEIQEAVNARVADNDYVNQYWVLPRSDKEKPKPIPDTCKAAAGWVRP